MGRPAIRLEDVAFAVGRKQILKEVCFDVEPGEVFALVGPSGCGKSTTLRLITGLYRTSKGTVTIFGKDAVEYGPNERCVATVWQGRALFPHMNVAANIGFGLKARGIERKERDSEIRSIARQFNLEELLSRDVTSLSGGEQQRVAVARALIVQPRILLLDEPFTGLDQALRLQLQSDLKRLLAKGDRTYVLVSHDFENVLALADRVAVMDQGRIVQIGPPREVWLKPRTGFVARFLGWSNVLPVTVSSSVPLGSVGMVETGFSSWKGTNRLDGSSMPGANQASYIVHPHDIRLNGSGDCQTTAVYWGKETREAYEVYFFELPNGVHLRVSLADGSVTPDVAIDTGKDVELSWDSSKAIIVGGVGVNTVRLSDQELLPRFIRDALAQKRVIKWGYVRQIGGLYPAQCDSVAAHSQAVTALAILLAHEYEERINAIAGEALSVADVALLGVFHDFGEGRSGDTGASSHAVRGRCELHSFEREGLAASVSGTRFESKALQLFDDYRAYRTPEALLVHVADNLEGFEKALHSARGAKEIENSLSSILRENLTIYRNRGEVDERLGRVADLLISEILLPGICFIAECYGFEIDIDRISKEAAVAADNT